MSGTQGSGSGRRPPDLGRLAHYGSMGGRSRRSFPVRGLLTVVLVAAVGAFGFALGRFTAPADDAAATTTTSTTLATTTVPPTTTTIARPPSSGEHVIEKGETLASIAAKYGTTAAALAAYNELANPDKIFWGLRLRIPPPGWTPPTTAVPSSVP